MAFTLAPEILEPGFSFENCFRNAQFAEEGLSVPPPTSTGTTIAGIIYRDGVILGADTRSTEDTMVADKNCMKIHYLAKNMYCCGAGTAADTVMTTQLIASQLELHRLNTGRTVPVVMATTLVKQMLFRYKGNIAAFLILGGVDQWGPHLYSVRPIGSSEKLPFLTMGSGAYPAMAVFENQWKPNLSERAGKRVVRNAVAAGMANDLASGNNVDLCLIRADGVKYLRNYEETYVRGARQAAYRYKRGTTAVLSTKVTHILHDTIVQWDEAMDVSE